MSVIGTIMLPAARGGLERFEIGEPAKWPAWDGKPFSRVAYSAAHVVAQPLIAGSPWLETAFDWDATLALRHRLWSLGLGVAEAMDTAQRGMGVDWPNSLELIRRSVREAKTVPGARLASGAGTDHLELSASTTLRDVIDAYEEQIGAIEALGGRIILMASRALAHVARDRDDYHKVYGRLLSAVREPVIIHWLGDMFDPALKGYWGCASTGDAMQVAIDIINAHADKVDGVKISLLDKQREIEMRRALDPRVRMYTGDDFNYAELIAGDELGYSHALLGIFDPIAPAASAALSALTAGRRDRFDEILTPTVPLSRLIFEPPTRFYKTGVVFMAYLNDWQRHFTMVGGQQSARSILHLSEIFRLASKAGLLQDPLLARQRMQAVLNTHGIW